MNTVLLTQVKEVIANSIGTNLDMNSLTDDFQLLGNLLDSMAVTNLILGLEEYFGFSFFDEELSAESFETVMTLTRLVEKKISGHNA